MSRADAVWWALSAEMIQALEAAETARLELGCRHSGGLTMNRKDLDQPDLVEVRFCGSPTCSLGTSIYGMSRRSRRRGQRRRPAAAAW